jgi:hypothetical protein
MIRRDFLKVAGTGAAGFALAGSAFAEGGNPRQPQPMQPGEPPADARTEHVILVAFAGGVRSKETLGTPANIPNLMKIAQGGVIMPSVRAANVGHYGAALSLFTGVVEVRGIRDNGRGPNPTLFEYARKQLRWGAQDVWLSAADGAQTVNFAHGTHSDYGAAYAANLIGSDGIFNAEFRTLLQSFGKPRVPGSAESDRLDRLAGALESKALDAAEDRRFASDPEHARRLQKFILEELTGGTSDLTGPGSGDAKAIRVAGNILKAFRPRIVGVVLGNADVAHSSYNAYVDVIRRNDAEIGRLWEAVQADPQLRYSTSIFVLPEFGRDGNLNQRNGLDHGDGTESLSKIACFAAGPEMARGKVHDRMVESIDIAPTIGRILRLRMEHANGKPITGILRG